MHVTKKSVKSKNVTLILAPLDPWKVKRGHAAHRTGAGTHQDRRTKRLRSRGDQRRVLGEE
jgi:hypothetical protein